MIEEYIINWLNTNTGLNTQSIYNFARKVDELHKEELKKQLAIQRVSQQRELLIAFQENFYKGIHDVDRKHIELVVDKYLNNL